MPYEAPPFGRVGSASRVAGAWQALWSDGKVLYFQSSRQRWIIGDGRATLEEHEGLRTFRLEQGGTTVFAVHYGSPASKLLNRLDPTYDSLDDELQDIFRYVVRVWDDSTIQKGIVADAAKCVVGRDD